MTPPLLLHYGKARSILWEAEDQTVYMRLPFCSCCTKCWNDGVSIKKAEAPIIYLLLRAGLIQVVVYGDSFLLGIPLLF